MTKIKLCVRYLYARYSNRHHYYLHAGTFMPALLLFSLFCSCRPSHQSTHPFERFSLQTTALLRNPNFASSPQLIHHIIDSPCASVREIPVFPIWHAIAIMPKDILTSGLTDWVLTKKPIPSSHGYHALRKRVFPLLKYMSNN